MGNSIQKKKKVETEKNFSAPPSPSPVREKPKGFWLFGRPDKLKTDHYTCGGKQSLACPTLIIVSVNGP
ncbi:uncharacterized protein AKAME5_002807300 [Lates japonicus]|uniref:Uncharacterized protein n=1 Tax=Lates japonicus TaxID=270547 RepID=A0AAD3R031_LATJO|nr:uncharacterized protein AKAME5_002807300 [Lates japonicus]